MTRQKPSLLAATLAAAMLAGIGTALAQQGAGPPPVIPPNQLFNSMDTNKDGAVSKQEYTDHYGKKFDAADKNKDGKITSDEMPTRSKGAPKTN